MTAGETLEDARWIAGEALLFHIKGMIEDDAPVPAPSKQAEIMADAHYRDAVAELIDALVRRPAVRINVSIPPDLLAAIDCVSDNRSRFLVEAAREQLRHA